MPSRGHMFDPVPPLWHKTRGGTCLAVGSRRIAIADIVRVDRRDRAERDGMGAMLLAFALMAAGGSILFGVMTLDWEARFVIASVLFMALGLMGFYEALVASTIRYASLRIETRSGETMHATAAPDVADAVERVIAAGGGQRSST